MYRASSPWRLLVFGANGAIGQAVVGAALSADFEVVGVGRKAPANPPAGLAQWVSHDPFAEGAPPVPVGAEPFDAVCWAQGANTSDSIYAFDVSQHLALYHANVVYIAKTMAELVAQDLLSSKGARMCVISSIWQESSRPDKLSYTMTKAALAGLVRSTSVDLAGGQHLVNAVLPGVLDTPMTRANMGPEQLERVEGSTRFGRLPDLTTVAELVIFFCSKANRSVTGQSVAIDLGFTNARLL